MIVCLCHRVSDRDIALEVRAGCPDFASLQDELLVGSACGACLEYAQETFDAQARACAGCPGATRRYAAAGALAA